MSISVADRVFWYARSQSLSERQTELLHLLVSGLEVQDIALRMELTYETVRTKCKRLYKVAGVGSRAQLTARAIGA